MGDGQQWVSVARVQELAPGTVKAVWVQDRSVALANVDGRLCAVSGVCPHREGPLGQGRLMGEELACPWHGFRYDLRTGRATVPTVHPGVPAYAVRVVGDDVQIALPEAEG